MTNQNSSSAPSGGISLVGALGLLFIGLKLGHVINWSWWLVTLPLWGGLALAIAILTVVVLVAVVVKAVKR